MPTFAPKFSLDIYRPLFWFIATVLATLSVCRVLLVCLYWSRVNAVDGLAIVLLQGLRFDLIIACALILPIALTLPFLSGSPRWSTAARLYLMSAFILALFMEAATPTFISEYDQRPNILFVEYLKYPKEVIHMLWGGYKLDIAIGLLVVFAVSIWVWKQLGRQFRTSQRVPIVPAIACCLLSLLICLVGIRSSFGHRPANPSKVAFSTDLLVNDLSLSSLYSVSYAMYSSKRHEKDAKQYGRMDKQKVIDTIKGSMVLPESAFLSAEIPTLHTSPWIEPQTRQKNVVIILQESLGAEFVGTLGGLDVTPNLDRLATQGIWFDNLYATGTRSVRGIEAVITGFTPTPARSVVKLPKSQSNFFTIAELLAREGYSTSFMYGGESHFDNMRQFFMGNGFQKIIEEKDYKSPRFKGSWGVSDQDLFDRAHQEFSKKLDEPFFSLVFTSSNHSPFEFPEGDFELYDEPRATVANAVKYADYAMGEFFEKAKKSSYWDNTIFLVVADHNSRVRGANLVPIEYFHIPALILGGGIEAQVNSRLASQIDLLPTLLGMLGITRAHPATGYDLFRPDIESISGRAIMQYNSTQAYMEGSEVVILEANKPPALYERSESGLERSSISNPKLMERALAFPIWSSTAYQKQLYRLPDL